MFRPRCSDWEVSWVSNVPIVPAQPREGLARGRHVEVEDLRMPVTGAGNVELRTLPLASH